MKSLMLLCKLVLEDLGTRCQTSTTRDLKTVARRFEHEGMSFLTICLPRFAKDFTSCLELGKVDHTMVGFSYHGGTPRFLGGFLDLVFDRGTGKLLDSPSIDAIFAIRQFCLMFEKMALECTEKRTRDTVRRYVECEQELKLADEKRSGGTLRDFHRMSTILWGNPMQCVNNDIQHERIVPRHGPGATAEGLSSNGKYNSEVWTDRLECIFPYDQFILANPHFVEDNRVQLLEPGAEPPSRMVAVPKTLKAPRLIAIEPVHMQYVQQGILESLVYHIEKGSDTPFPWLIGFTDQSPNREMAREGSLSGELATLDLSEASDRVSNQLVLEMTRRMPFLSGGLQASRSSSVDVLGEGVLSLSKFASMGSAVCFPVEAMVFSTVVMIGIERQLNRPLTLRDISSFKGQVRVYGDDIIVPVRFVESVMESLELYGFKANHAKSFWTGKFRESCGGDFYDGVDITVSRLRRSFPKRRGDVMEIISLVNLRNQLYFAGLWGAARGLDRVIRKFIPFPTVGENSPVLGRHSRMGFETQKMCPRLHRPLVKGAVVTSVIPPDYLDGHGALLKFFLKRGDSPVVDREHLSRSGRARTVGIKTSWAPSC